MEIKEARKLFPKGTEFLSATNNLRIPLRVTTLLVANHTDRKNKIKELELNILALWNTENPKRVVDFFRKVPKSFQISQKEFEEREFLLSLPSDIVNEEGGVIWCGETNTLAKLC